MLRHIALCIFIYIAVAGSSSAALCDSNSNEHNTPEEARDNNEVWLKSVCKESDQNVFIQGRLQVLQPKEADPPSEHEEPGHVMTPTNTAIELQETAPAQVPFENFADLPVASSIEKIAMAPGAILERMAGTAPVPSGWWLFPALCIFFLLLMHCTETHPDSYGMEEEEKDDTTRPPMCVDRLPLFDIARFGLVVSIIWTQLILGFGHSTVTLTLHEFLWPTWFFLAGIFGSSCAYQSVSRVVCYSITTNCLLACLGTLFAFFNYHSEALPSSFFFGGGWVLWCLLLYRLTITPLFHVARTLRVPGVLLLITIVYTSYTARLHMSPINVVVDRHSRQIEQLLLMMKTYDATIRSAVLNAPYFAIGLLLTPSQWNSLLSSNWFTCIAVANTIVGSVVTVTPLLYSLAHWNSPERPWGIKLLIYVDSLSGFSEDAACYIIRMSAVLLFLCWLFIGASLLTRAAPELTSYISGCGSRIRYTITLFVLWYMIRPCILSPPQLPFQRSSGINDLAMGVPALFIALALTSSGTQQLFRWIVEPYWAKCCIEGCCKRYAEQFCELKRPDRSYVDFVNRYTLNQQTLHRQNDAI